MQLETTAELSFDVTKAIMHTLPLSLYHLFVYYPLLNTLKVNWKAILMLLRAEQSRKTA
jgi:hypothetical protein